MTQLPPLRGYQIEAIDQALEEEHQLLAMTMGSGKTRTVIEVAARLIDEGKARGGCAFVLNSTKFQWKREIEQWSGLSVQVIDGTKYQRVKQYYRAYHYQITILNYDALVHDWDLIQDHLPIDFVIADEVTAIKSFVTKRSRRLKELGSYAGYRFGMSGQPVENRPEELFSIMEFVNPKVLGTFHKFDKTFITRDHWGKPKRYKNLDVLQRKMGRSMFRRSRDDLARYLPKIVDIETAVPLDPSSYKLYDYIRRDLLEVIELAVMSGIGGWDIFSHYGKQESEESSRFKGMVMARITAMRLLCDHPDLLRMSAAEFDDEDTPKGSQYASELAEAGMLDNLPSKSHKLTALIDGVQALIEEDPTYKIVVFSGFKGMLTLINQELKRIKIRSTRIDGDVASAVRDERIVRFNTDPDLRVFLSSDAGAYGVNLDAGSHLISYDLPWSSGAFSQRVARIDRLSSSHGTIFIDSMFTEGTIEERQLNMLKQKRQVSDAFLDGKHTGGVLTLSLSSLREFMLDIESPSA